jgi:dienelactone hydrolase
MSGPGECCVDPGAKQSHQEQGREELIADLQTYKVGEGKSVVVFFTDIFGYSFVNTRRLADHFAQALNSTVLVPDFFHGDPMDPRAPNLFEKLPTWLQKHPVDAACTAAVNFIGTIKAQYDSIRVIGFCYGAKAVVHPTFLVKEEAGQIQRPILFICAETDQRFTPDLRLYYEQTLASTGWATFIDYPGTVHGFVIRPDGTEHVEQQRDKAVRDAIDYFKQH